MANAAKYNKRAVAVIIGNSNYQGRTPKVDYAGNDADAFKKYVIDVLRYDPENIIDLRDATKTQMEAAFGNHQTAEGKLWRYIDPKGRSDVTVFYSGHGVPGLKDKRGYLLPVDADPETPEINGYSVDTLFKNLGLLETKSVSVYLDACFSGDSQKGMLISRASGLVITPHLPTQAGNMTIITASQGDQVASWDDRAKRGLFTRHLLDALYGKADGEDYGNSDGQVALGEVREYLDDRLTRAARRTFGRHQNAWATGNDDVVLTSDFSNKTQPTIVLASKRVEPVKAKPVPVKKAKPSPPPQPVQPLVKKKPAAPAFDVARLANNSRWQIDIEIDDVRSDDYSGVLSISDGTFSKSFFHGSINLNIWGSLWRGELEINGSILDQSKRGYDDEVVTGKFSESIYLKRSPVTFRIVPAQTESGGVEIVIIRLRLIR